MTASTTHSSTPQRVAVAGASGRMGHMLIEAILNSSDCVLAAALDRADSLPSGPIPRPFWANPAA